MNSAELIAESAYLRLLRRDGWDFVQRKGCSGVAIVAALTAEGRVLFVEQFRPALGARVVELPAGLAGDLAGAADEPLEQAARRELLEETGYDAAQIRAVWVGATSSGLTDELVTFCVATGLSKTGSGGGDGSESITVHEVPLEQVDAWLESKREQGCVAGARIFTALYLLERHLHGGRRTALN